MADISWQRQTKDHPAFPDTLWSRPVNKRHAGKLLVIGGHKQSFSAASRAFTAASGAGAGTVRILLPDSLQKTVGKLFPEAEFVPSTPIGSFGRQALGLFLDLAAWSDGVLLAGDLGKNSETTVLLDGFLEKYTGLLSVTGDSLDYFSQKSEALTGRPNALVVGDLSQIQKLAQPQAAIKQNADLVQVLESLGAWTASSKASLITAHTQQIITAANGRLSTTKTNTDKIEPELAAYACVWLMQQPEKPFEALTTAVYCLSQT